VTSIVTFDADTITTRLQDVLQSITDSAAALPDAVALPDRVILTSGNATWDCPMTYAMLMSVQHGLPEPDGADLHLTGQYTHPQGNLPVWTLTLDAGIVRPVTANPAGVPRSGAPDPTRFTADLAGVSSDTAVLINAAMSLGNRDYQPVPHLVNAVASQGGFHGVAMTLTVEAWPAP
jgi:hypothetical protein